MREETIKSCTTYVQDDCVRRENVQVIKPLYRKSLIFFLVMSCFTHYPVRQKRSHVCTRAVGC